MTKIACVALALAMAWAPLQLRAGDEKKDDAASMKAPELPKTDDIKDSPSPGVGESSDGGADADKADVAVPDGEPVVKAEPGKVTQAKPGHFRWGNFFLGALGGAVIIGTGAIISGATNNASGGQLDGTKVAIWTGSGALGGGLLSMLLGATSPLPVTPPDMSLLPLPLGREVAFSVHF
jgi:hypothetical protein